jgi:hypothetical protein
MIPVSNKHFSWTVIKLWEDATVYIIGGGPSLNQQIHLLPRLYERPTVGINSAYKLGEWVDVIYFGDLKFYKWNKQELDNWGGLIITTCDDVKAHQPRSNMKFVKRQSRGWSEDPRFCAWNGSSGAAACNLAYLMGAKRLILLGFDMKSSGELKTKDGEPGVDNWHGYHQLVSKASVHKRHKDLFANVSNGATLSNVEIYNASPNSAMDYFPKLSLEECLDRW